jgi:hypothetical protein
MKRLDWLAIGVALAAFVLPKGLAADRADDAGTPRAMAPASPSSAAASMPYVPKVLREGKETDSAVFTLPVPPKFEEGPPPVLRHTDPEPSYPAPFVKDSVAFLTEQLNNWQEADAFELLGKAKRERTSYDDEGKPNGSIFAYDDPLHRYREFELDFEGDSGKLRSVFAYPMKLSWRDCRKTYGTSFTSADAGSGRIFFSYVNRRLDVLVDASGNVISLGIY